uniref:Peptidase S1 domain-containing protein n=1 Tax=Megaselia scalaris TaxID=36166 RepID=T1GM63_MEGSC
MTGIQCLELKQGSGTHLKEYLLGEHNLDLNIDCEHSWNGRPTCAPPAKDISIEKQIKHPNHDRIRKIHDIAILKLSESVSLSNRAYINTICLPIDMDSKATYSQKKFLITGWGFRENSKKISNVLMKAVVPVQPLSKCKEIFDIKYTTETTSMCAGGESQIDQCNGDSGGPLFCTGKVIKHGRYIQNGIMTHSMRECDSRFVLSGSWYQGLVYNLAECDTGMTIVCNLSNLQA